MSPRYVEGWNDRVAKRGESYGKAFRSLDGALRSSDLDADKWSQVERAECVRGWEEADAKIASLRIEVTR